MIQLSFGVHIVFTRLTDKIDTAIVWRTLSSHSADNMYTLIIVYQAEHKNTISTGNTAVLFLHRNIVDVCILVYIVVYIIFLKVAIVEEGNPA